MTSTYPATTDIQNWLTYSNSVIAAFTAAKKAAKWDSGDALNGFSETETDKKIEEFFQSVIKQAYGDPNKAFVDGCAGSFNALSGIRTSEIWIKYENDAIPVTANMKASRFLRHSFQKRDKFISTAGLTSNDFIDLGKLVGGLNSVHALNDQHADFGYVLLTQNLDAVLGGSTFFAPLYNIVNFSFNNALAKYISTDLAFMCLHIQNLKGNTALKTVAGGDLTAFRNATVEYTYTSPLISRTFNPAISPFYVPGATHTIIEDAKTNPLTSGDYTSLSGILTPPSTVPAPPGGPGTPPTTGTSNRIMLIVGIVALVMAVILVGVVIVVIYMKFK